MFDNLPFHHEFCKFHAIASIFIVNIPSCKMFKQKTWLTLDDIKRSLLKCPSLFWFRYLHSMFLMIILMHTSLMTFTIINYGALFFGPLIVFSFQSNQLTPLYTSIIFLYKSSSVSPKSINSRKKRKSHKLGLYMNFQSSDWEPNMTWMTYNFVGKRNRCFIY